MLTDKSTTVTASILPTDADNSEIIWSCDQNCITVSPHPTIEKACVITSGTNEGCARVTATAAAEPTISEGFNITVLKAIALTEPEGSVSSTGQVYDRGTTASNQSFYVVYGLNTSTEYLVTVSNIEDAANQPIGDYQVALGMITSELATLEALYTEGYSVDEPPLFFQGFVTNEDSEASIIFHSTGDRGYFAIADASENGDLGTFTYDLEISAYAGNKELLETIQCSSGTEVDTYFYVYNEDVEIICGGFDKTYEDGYSRVMLPAGSLPEMFWIRVAAQENNEEGFPTVVDSTIFDSTGDFAMHFNEEAGIGTITYTDPLPSALIGIEPSPPELQNEHNPEYNDNYLNYPDLVSGTPDVRKISSEGITNTDGITYDEDWFKRL